ncbi:hypothetical protein VNO78_16825 [Psophocarpus tetragonolobus]|uniref:Uncharacterized protein n=1 Tax=Psophocarpus tetragonolobus TaxID=3891 RepID=A0AAN9SG48_PSOTE
MAPGEFLDPSVVKLSVIFVKTYKHYARKSREELGNPSEKPPKLSPLWIRRRKREREKERVKGENKKL